MAHTSYLRPQLACLTLGSLVLAAACSSTGTLAEPAGACPSPSGAGMVHAADVVQDERWRAEDGPHRIEGRVAIRNGATVTIDACVEVRLAESAELDVGVEGTGETGTLLVQGTQGAPVRFGRDRAAAFGSVAIFAPARAELRHVRLEGGGASSFRDHATLHVVGDGTSNQTGPLLVEDVEVIGSAGHGVVLAGAAVFAPGSRRLFVRGSGAALPGTFPLVAGEHALSSLPDGDLRGNAQDEVLIREDLADGFVGLSKDATMHALTVPYHIGTGDGEPFRIGSSSGKGLATLTVEPGVTMRFHPNTMLRVLAGPDAPTGAIRAIGTEAAPITFTSAAASPKAGDWAGLYFEGPISAHNEITHAVIEDAGGYCSCSLSSCSPITFSNAALILDGAAPDHAFVSRTTIRDSAGHGVLRSWLGRADVDFLGENRFERIAGCAQTSPVLDEVVCPDAAYRCDGQ